MSLLENRWYFKPFEYPWAFSMYKAQQEMHWMPEEVPLHEDVKDWQKNLTPEEKKLLTQIFRFFTQGDVDVAHGYYDKLIPLFPKPEVRMMLGAFANMESVHQHAYSLLLDTVGMPEAEYKAFAEYQEMAEKHDYLANISPDTKDMKSVLKAIAVYSGFTEGMQLFSSFAILMNLTRFGKMKGMGQIVTWSIRDESLHVKGMTTLFRELVKENMGSWTDEVKSEIYQACRDMVDLEDKFIDLCFGIGGEIKGLSAEDTKQYIRYIADRRLLQLGLKTNYGVKENPIPWLEWVLSGVEHANFFEARATEYNKGALKGSWDQVWAT